MEEEKKNRDLELAKAYTRYRQEVFSGALVRRYSEDKESHFIKLDGTARQAHPHLFAVTDENSWSYPLKW